MDITFYALVTLASGVLLLAMWACSSHGVKQWGPDLTMELPVHLLQEVLFPSETSKPMVKEVVPSAPSNLSGDTLLMRVSVPQKKKKRALMPPNASAPPLEIDTSIGAPLLRNMDISHRPIVPPKPFKATSAVRVLPPTQFHKLKTPPNCFTLEHPA